MRRTEEAAHQVGKRIHASTDVHEEHHLESILTRWTEVNVEFPCILGCRVDGCVDVEFCR